MFLAAVSRSSSFSQADLPHCWSRIRCDQHLYMFGAAITHSDNTDLGLPVVDPLFKVSDSVFGN